MDKDGEKHKALVLSIRNVVVDCKILPLHNLIGGRGLVAETELWTEARSVFFTTTFYFCDGKYSV